jgi:hypothetical protein
MTRSFTQNYFDIVVYHFPCVDGFTAAWVAHRHSPDATFIPARHGEPPPDVRGRRVLILDFAYDLETMRTLHAEASDLVILDHHKTNRDDLVPMSMISGPHPPCIVFDMSRSGAGIAFDVLFPRLPRPAIVDLVEDRDLWRFKFPASRAFHAGLSLRPWTFEAWTDASMCVEEVVEDGRPVLQAISKIVESIAKRSSITMLGGYKFCSANVPPEYVSEVGSFLNDLHPRLPFLGWSWNGETETFACSLRSRVPDGPDVSEIAREWGGGGHRHAAGFRLPYCPVTASSTEAEHGRTQVETQAELKRRLKR